MWTAVKFPFTFTPKQSFKRRLIDTAFRCFSDSLNTRQMQYVTGTTNTNYATWAKKNGLPAVIDEVGSNARLLWIGKKDADRVVLCFHGIKPLLCFLNLKISHLTWLSIGGSYFCPLQEFAISFWSYVRTELKRQYQIDAGIAILEYCIYFSQLFLVFCVTEIYWCSTRSDRWLSDTTYSGHICNTTSPRRWCKAIQYPDCR